MVVAWVAVPAIVGVVVGTLLGPAPAPLLLALTAAWGAALASYRRARPVPLVAAVAIGASAAGGGIGSLDAARRLHPPLPRQVAPHLLTTRTPVTLEGRLRDDAASTAFGASLTLDVSGVASPGRSAVSGGGVRLAVGGRLAAEHVEEWTRGRAVRVPVALRRPQPYRNPGVPDQDVALARREVAFLGTVKSAALVEIIAPAAGLEEAAAVVRRWVRRRVRDTVGAWSARSSAVAVAILIGDRAGLDDAIEERLRRAGTYHVMAISGGNIAVLTAWLLVIGRVCRLPARAAAVCTAAGVASYAFIVGSAASVVRASVVAVIYLLGLYLDLRAAPLTVTIAAAGGILVARPLWWFDPGFWLTFGATAGILLGAPRLHAWSVGLMARWLGGRRVLSTVVNGVAGLAAATVAAEAALLPLGAFLFSRVTVAGLVLNLVAVPLMTALQVSAMTAVALSLVSLPVATALAWVPHACAVGILDSATLVDLAPWTTRRMPAPSVVVLAGYYAAWVGWFVARRRASRRVALAALGVIALTVLRAPPAPRWLTSHPRSDLVRDVAALERARGPLLGVLFLDVGQGDAALITFPDGARWLVDAGGLPNASGFDVGERVVGPALWALGARRLDRIVVTHGHPDHAGGAPAIIDDFAPRFAWQGVPVAGDPTLEAVSDRARRVGTRVTSARVGQRVERGDVVVRVLHPPPPEWQRRRVRNDDSIGVEVRRGEVSIVLTGDASASVEPVIAEQIGPASLRILKVPHHGSRGASSLPFLAQLRPALAVVSAGAGNPFGHPSVEALARYRAQHVPVLRTDVEGAVWVGTDGRCVWVRTFAGRDMSLGGDPCAE